MAKKSIKRKPVTKKGKSGANLENNGAFDLKNILSSKKEAKKVSKKVTKKTAKKKKVAQKVSDMESILVGVVDKMEKSKNFKLIYSSAVDTRGSSSADNERFEFVFRHKVLAPLCNKERDLALYFNFPRFTKGVGARISPVFNYSPIGDPSGNVLVSNHYGQIIPHRHTRPGSEDEIEAYIRKAIENAAAIVEIENKLKKISLDSEKDALGLIRRFIEVRLDPVHMSTRYNVDPSKADPTQFLTLFPGLEIKNNLQSILVNTSLNMNSKDNFLSFEYPKTRAGGENAGEEVIGRILHPVNSVIRNAEIMEDIAQIWDDCFTDYYLGRGDFKSTVGKIF